MKINALLRMSKNMYTVKIYHNDFNLTLKRSLGKEAIKEYYPMQPGDVYQTYADVSDLMNDFDFKPDTPIDVGLAKFVEWYREYYKI